MKIFQPPLFFNMQFGYKMRTHAYTCADVIPQQRTYLEPILAVFIFYSTWLYIEFSSLAYVNILSFSQFELYSYACVW